VSTSHLDALIDASDSALQVVGSARDGVPGLPAVFRRDCYSRLEEGLGDVDFQVMLLDADPEFPVLTINAPREAANDTRDASHNRQRPEVFRVFPRES